MSITENEFRVRAVTRYVVTHFTSTDYGNDRVSGGCEQYGEFPNIYQAEAVAKALHETTPGSTMATMEKIRESYLPPNSVSADFVHYMGEDTADNICKALRLTEPGKHAVVINIVNGSAA